MDLDIGPDDVTRALQRLKGFHSSSSSPISDYNADIEDLVETYSALDSYTLDPYEVQIQMFEVVRRALDISVELADAQPCPSGAAAGSRHDQAVRTSCEDDPPPKRRRLEPEAPSSPEDEASPPVISLSELAEDLRILAIGALDTGITTIKRSGCTGHTARAMQGRLFGLLNHEGFAGSKLHPVLQTALIQSLPRVKDEIMEYYGWPGLDQYQSDQLVGIINTPNIHPAVMHAAVTAVKSLAPDDMPAEVADTMLEAICCWALSDSKASDRLSALLL